MEENKSDIYNHYPSFLENNPIHYNNPIHNPIQDNNDKLEDIENSINSSLINNNNNEKRKSNICLTNLKLLEIFLLVGILFLLGAIIVLIMKKY